ncbi:MAG: adenylate/guanylate cyclase domain-containing protein [Aquihabitans sp.]
MTCPACGASAPVGARFCASCGQALRSVDDERRVVTVLFGDLVGFTALSERLDPEQVKNLVDRCFDRLAEEVTMFGGRVDKIVGDAIVALFGAPVAHEDDAERAVRAGLRMQQVLDAEVANLGQSLEIRVGVNTGEVLVGAMRAAGSITAMGDVVNTASRLQTAAAPGQVFVGPSTYAATAQTISYEAKGLVSARGRETPIETWRALAPVSTPGYRVRREDTPLIGRNPEVGLLRHATDTAIKNQRALLVLVVADAGMGKTRLVDEVTRWAARTHGAVGREGRCLPYGEASVWWPVADAMRDGLGVGEGDPIEVARLTLRHHLSLVLDEPDESPEVVRSAEGLLTLFGYDPPLGADPAGIRAEATRALGVYTRSFAARHPLILKISDVHFADDAVLDLIDDVMAAVHQRPIVVLATARPTLLDRWSPRTGRHNSLMVHLDPLSRDASAALLERLVGKPVPREVADTLIGRSGGNPLFIEELVSLIDGSGSYEGIDAVSAVDSFGSLPSTLRGLVAARLDDLDHEARTVLQNASVIGQQGPMMGLREMSRQLHELTGDGPMEDVDAAMSRLVSDEIMELQGEVWSFRSDVVREVAYQTITKADRARSHLGIARYIEARAEKIEARPAWQVDQLAHHYSTAVALAGELGPVEQSPGITSEVVDRARHCVVDAAERARRDQAMPTAVRLFGQAIELTGTIGPAEQAMLHLRRADTAVEAWDLDTARSEVAAVAALERTSVDPPILAEVLAVRGRIAQRSGDAEASMALLTDAAQEFEMLGDQRGQAEALRQRAMVEIFAGRLVDAGRSAEEALVGFEQSGDRSGVGWSHQHLAWIAFMSGDRAAADAHIQTSLANFTEVSDTRGLVWGTGLLAWIRFQDGNIHEARRLGEQVLDEARSRSDPWADAMMTLLMASIQLWTGATEDAVDLAETARRRFDSLGDEYGLEQSASVLGRALVMVGQVEDGFALMAAPLRPLAAAHTGRVPVVDLSQGAPPAAAVHRGVVVLLARLGTALQVGEPARAVGLVDELLERRDGGDDLEVSQALLALQSGDLDRAGRHLDGGQGSTSPASVVSVGQDTHANRVAVRALWQALAGLPGADAAAARLDDLPGTTYFDRIMAQIAVAIEAAVNGRSDDARAAVDNARGLAAATDDRIAQLVVELAAVEVAQRADDPGQPELAARSLRLADALDIEPQGWTRLLALGRTATAA